MPQHKLIPSALVLVMLATSVAWLAAADSPSGSASREKPDESVGVVRSSPVDSGDVDPKYWGHLTEEQQAQAVAQLQAFAQKAGETLKLPLHLQESHYFLVYSDLTPTESLRCVFLLDRMYGRLCELFAVEKGRNLWRGKGLMFVFSRIEYYRLYERMMENTDPGESFAMTHCFGDGMVHTAFARFPNQAQFEHLLVHESVHGFLHRYRSPARIPSWANEGLADQAAAEVVGNPMRTKLMLGFSRAGVEKHNNSVGDFFTARHIDGWQYPIAETLTAWMIHKDRQGYLDFINGIKDGQAWNESLTKNFKMPPKNLLTEYGKALGVKELK